MAPKGVTWDAATDRKLLLGILGTQNFTVDYQAMAQYMSTDEQPCTVEAIKSRLKKLKAMVKDATHGDGTISPTSTPKPKTTPASKKRGLAADASEETPKKKTKGAEKVARAETPDDEEGDGVNGNEETAIKEEANGDD